MRSLITALSLTLAWANAAHANVEDHRWHRVATPEFEMLSDLAPEDARALADRLTRFRLAAQGLLVPRRSSDPPLRIIAFRHARDFRRVFSLRKVGGFTLSSLDRYTLAFGPDARRGYAGGALTAFHEYTHYLLHNRQQMNYPAWYEEGFANFLSTIYVSEDGAVVGDVPAIKRWQMARSRLKLAELLDERFVFDWNRRDLEEVYLKAWLFVHMLQHGHLTGLPEGHPASIPPFHARVPEMLEMINAGAPARDAIEKSLGVDLPTLERMLRAYGKRRSLPTRILAVDVEHETPMDVQPLAPAQVWHALARAAEATGNRHFAARLYQRVLGESPDDVDALVGLSATTEDPARSLTTARRALALNESHPGANIRMAKLSVSECQQATREQCYQKWRDSAEFYRRAVRSDPEGVDAVFGLGVVYLHVGQAGDALGYLRVAYQRAPWAPPVNLYLGEAYRLVGDAESARAHLTKAMHWHRDERWRERAALALSMIDSNEDR